MGIQEQAGGEWQLFGAAYQVGITTDIRGAPRFLDDPLTPDTGIGFSTVDMGAYEFFLWSRRRANVPVPFAPPRVLR